MDLSKEAIEKIVDMAAPSMVQHRNWVYSDRTLKLVGSPQFEGHVLSTLSGLVDLVGVLLPEFSAEGLMCVVDGPLHVSLFAGRYDVERRLMRLAVVKGSCPHPFEFGRYMDAEDFCVGLLSRFVPDEAMRAVYAVASHLTSGESRQDDDTGLGQRVTVKTGVATREEVVVGPHHSLRPFCAFSEVEQPARVVLLRMKYEKDRPPRLALFDADGGGWVVAAKASIQKWLAERVPDGVTVVS